jgi:hypothetical protein
MKLTATHSDPQAVAPAHAALTKLGFSNIRIDFDSARAALRPAPSDDKFDTIVCPGGKQGVEKWFYGKNKWRWVRVDRRKVDSIKYLAIYETVLDAENNHAPGGRGEVLAYAPVQDYEVAPSGKYCFTLGDIEPLAVPAGGNYHLQNFHYTKLDDLRKAATLEELFSR